MKIIVKCRGDSFVAHLEGSPAEWEAGKTSGEAVGKLIVSFPDKLNVQVVQK